MAAEIDYIGYGFDAGPLPPMHYSRHEIIAQPGQITDKRWQGMEPVVERTFPLTAEQFQQIVAAYSHFQLKNKQLEILEDGSYPVGGSSEWVVVKAQEQLLEKGGVELEGNAKGFVKLLESFIPDEGKSRSPLMK